MKAAEFVAGYEREALPSTMGPAYDAVMAEPREWSCFLGKTLHMVMTEDDAVREYCTQGRWNGYRNWLDGGGIHQTASAMMMLDDEQRARASNEFNVHRLHYAMTAMWAPILAEGGWGRRPNMRRTLIDDAQTRLAAFGVEQYVERQAYIKQLGGTEALYGKQNMANRPLYKAFVGCLQEFDAAVVLLDVMRQHEDITVIPAPMQFEASGNKGRNADFLAVHSERDTMIGIQVKSRLQPRHVQEADKERIIFIDGDTDLGNVRRVRFIEGKTSERVVTWPGIISAKYMSRVRLHGKRRVRAAGHQSPLALRFKLMAHEHVGDITVNYRDLSNKIGERVMDRLLA